MLQHQQVYILPHRGGTQIHIHSHTHTTWRYNTRDCKFIMGITSSNVKEILEKLKKALNLNIFRRKKKYFANRKTFLTLYVQQLSCQKTDLHLMPRK